MRVVERFSRSCVGGGLKAACGIHLLEYCRPKVEMMGVCAAGDDADYAREFCEPSKDSDAFA